MRALLLTVGLGGVILAGPVAAQDLQGDPEAGRQVAGMCRTCHGLDGLAQVPIAPSIGGEREAYLASQLLAFKSGEREHEMMTVVAQSLSEQQIADVAAWFASQTVHPVLPEGFDPEAAPELCSGCHGADGIALLEEAPNLAGENQVYLETQLKAFRDGRRVHEIMTQVAADLTPEEMRAVTEWYAAIGLEVEAE